MIDHVEVLRHMKETIKAIMPSEVEALDAAIAALSAPQPPSGGEVMEPMTGDLLPCPFCGKSNQDRWPCEWLDGSGANVIRCAWCHGAAPLNAWNRRTAPPSAPVGVDLDKVAAHLAEHGGDFDALIRLVQEAALAQQPAVEYQRMQPCGCVLCVCEDENRCHGCGAKHCGNRTGHPAYVTQQPAAVDGTLLRELRGHEVERLLRRYAAQHDKTSPRMAQMMELGARAVAALAAQQPAAADGAMPALTELVATLAATGLVTGDRIYFPERQTRELLKRARAALAAQPGGSDNDR